MTRIPAAKISLRDAANAHGSTNARGNASTSDVDIAAVITFTDPRSLEADSLDEFRARRMMRASGTIAQTYTAQNTSAYGQTNGGGVILPRSAPSARARSSSAAPGPAVGPAAVSTLSAGRSMLASALRFRFRARSLIRLSRSDRGDALPDR